MSRKFYNLMKIIDISLPLNNQTPTYPGDETIFVKIHQKMPEHSSTSSSIRLGSHTGTHVDAPVHAILGAPTLDAIPLENFIGPCRVLDFSLGHSPTGEAKELGEAVTKEFLESKDIKPGERILLKTKNSLRGYAKFYDDFIYLDGDAAEYLAGLHIQLIGIDYLSIKKRGSADNRPHLAFLSKDIPIIEGLNLAQAKEGEYDLYCLPLRLTGIDGAPARAVLIEK